MFISIYDQEIIDLTDTSVGIRVGQIENKSIGEGHSENTSTNSKYLKREKEQARRL
jgi:hypothetical protein